MISHNILSALRTLGRNKLYFFINLFCLAISFTCIIVISGYITFEKSFDTFHKDYKNIYRITSTFTVKDKQYKTALSPAALGSYLKQTVPGVEDYVEISTVYGPWTFDINGEKYNSEYYYATKGLCNVFSFDIIDGDKTSFRNPRSCMISESLARNWFGDKSPVGENLQIDFGELNIVAVFKDFPGNSHFHPNIIVRMYDSWKVNEKWNSSSYHTYFKAGNDFNRGNFQTVLDKINKDKFSPAISKDNPITSTSLSVQDINSIHLTSGLMREYEPSGNASYVKNIFWVAILILLVTIINFNNLTSVQFKLKYKELGIKLIMGRSRLKVINSFILGPVIIILLSIFFSLLLVGTVFYFKNSLPIDLYWPVPAFPVFVELIVFFLIVTLPFLALQLFFSLSKMSAIQLVKSKGYDTGRRIIKTGNLFIIFQFLISAFLIGTTLSMFNQIKYVSRVSLGMNPDQVINIKIEHGSNSPETIENEWLKIPGVMAAASTTDLPGNNPEFKLPLEVNTPNGTKTEQVIRVSIDPGYLQTLGIQLKTGRNIQRWVLDSANLEAFVNEEFVKTFELQEPIGTELDIGAESNDKHIDARIVGVVKDFHFSNLHEKILPGVFFNGGGHYLLAKVSPKNIHQTLSSISNTVSKINGTHDFEVNFLDDHFADQYKSDLEKNKLFFIFTIIAILISCLGLFTISARSIITKTKETGIRKILGATTPGLVVKYMLNFTILSIIGFLIAIPFIYFYIRNWLMEFAYKMEPGITIYLLTFVILTAISIMTVIYNSYRSAKINPAEALRQQE